MSETEKPAAGGPIPPYPLVRATAVELFDMDGHAPRLTMRLAGRRIEIFDREGQPRLTVEVTEHDMVLQGSLEKVRYDLPAIVMTSANYPFVRQLGDAEHGTLVVGWQFADPFVPAVQRSFANERGTKLNQQQARWKRAE